MDLPDKILTAASQIEQPADRPLVTVSYAQSLDGSIAARRGERTQISGPESAKLTHTMRAYHDAILIGIGTLLSDDPQLTVRLVDGENPRPVILDRKLRTPIDSFLMRSNPPWILTSEDADLLKAEKLASLGAKLFYLPANELRSGQLLAVLEILHREGIRQLMVEGGASVLASFLTAQLVDFLVVTISPLILGGLPAVQFIDTPDFSIGNLIYPRLEHMGSIFAGEDLVVYGRPCWIKDN
jgi:3,4-dihydroxy 2-butanone 4-phosphate synthase/GTP cyclohydrolase II